MRILLVEDERSLSRAVSTILQKNNYAVDCVENGKLALEYLEKDIYDLVIMDIMMPVMDGITALKILRLDNAFKYSTENGNISFSMSASGNYINIKVINDVKHVDKKMTERMFDRFYRADETAANVTGFGLGLSIAKAIVNEHNGNIKAKVINEQKILFKAQLKIR